MDNCCGTPLIFIKLAVYSVSALVFMIAITVQGFRVHDLHNQVAKRAWIWAPASWVLFMIATNTCVLVSWGFVRRVLKFLPETPPFVDPQTNTNTPILFMYSPVLCSSRLGKHLAEITLYCYCVAACETEKRITLMISLALSSCLCCVKVFTPRVLLVDTMKKASIGTSVAIVQNLIKKRFLEAIFVGIPGVVCVFLLLDKAESLHRAVYLDNAGRWTYNRNIHATICYGCCGVGGGDQGAPQGVRRGPGDQEARDSGEIHQEEREL